jgi:putative MFS transporter
MQHYGAAILETEPSAEPVPSDENSHRYGDLFLSPLTGLTTTMVLLAAGIGVVQYGFQQWIPSNLQALGYSEASASSMLRDASLLGFPLNFPIAFLYGMWSSRKTIVIMASVTALALVGFVLAGDKVQSNDLLLYVLLVAPIWGISSLTAVTAAYASEIYPTVVRGRGTGLVAAGTKMGGVLILALVAASFAVPSITTTALLGAIPLLAGVVAIVFFGIETRTKTLEEITAEEAAAA